MTLGCPASTEDHPGRRITRRVTSLALSIAGVLDGGPPPVINKIVDAATRSSTSSHLSRQVSNDGLVSISDSENDKEDYSSSSSGRTSPIRCVSEFDNAVEACPADSDAQKKSFCRLHPQSISIPLHDPKFLQIHTHALRLEAELQPMRLILSRLMAHTTLNRKGIFNSPVDPVALGLPDYFQVIQKPMDLGLVKVKLHAIAYLSRREVADDIRLVFANAMKYNPPHNSVHVAARELLAFFEDQVQAFAPELCFHRNDASATAYTREEEEEVALSAAASTHPPATTAFLPSVPTVHTSSSTSATSSQATRKSSATSGDALLEPIHLVKKRKKRGSKINVGHACHRCQGRTCRICHQGCMPLEPSLLICNGANCAGARIRKGAVYFVSSDGGRHFCQRCHTSLPAVLPSYGHHDDGAVRYKRDLLKRKNDEEIVERWLSCSQCDGAVHAICAMHDEYVHSEENYHCPDCVMESYSSSGATPSFGSPSRRLFDGDLYTFVSGSEQPIKLSDVSGTVGKGAFSAENLPVTEVSAFMERKIRERLQSDTYPNAERTVLVRTISDCHRCFKIPEVVRTHFRMATKKTQDQKGGGGSIAPPSTVNYRSKAIALFQKIDGLDVCIFCMYVHEYDREDHFTTSEDSQVADQKKRVYIAYIDSVEHFRPRTSRTSVYHEMLVSYLATARKRGFETAHIWSCPPARGNCFVFWNHPYSQRTPNPERLEAWYHAALSRAVDCGVVTNVQSLYETDFESQLQPDSNAQRLGFLHCPPLLDGDFWIEEAVRVHNTNMTRQLRTKMDENDPLPSAGPSGSASHVERCPARQIAAMLKEAILPHPASLPFRRPVNAAAMKLTDYHSIITNPMDLGTVYSRSLLGEYDTLADLVADVELVISNAKTYNPKGHVVHTKADEVRDLFFSELNRLARSWVVSSSSDESSFSWEAVANVRMSLDLVLDKLSESSSEALQHSSFVRLQFDDSLVGADTRITDSPSDRELDHISLVGGGPEAVHQRMVGNDTWLLEKNPVPSKDTSFTTKRGCSRRRKFFGESDEEPPAKRRRQAWLGIEVGAAVRRMRTSFFTCSLVPNLKASLDEQRTSQCFDLYARDYDPSLCEGESCTSTIADLRHSLLDLSQFRNLEFDTLRHAKYSTAILLYHFHNDGAAGAVPVCSNCKHEIAGVRWHKLMKVIDLGRRKGLCRAHYSNEPEELCDKCFRSGEYLDEQFIPLQVSMQAPSQTD